MASSATLVDAQSAQRTASAPALRGLRAESAHRLRLFRLRRVRVVVGRFRADGALTGRLCRWSVGGNTAVRRPALRGPPPLTCGEADGCDAGRVGLQGQDRATCCIAHPFGGYAARALPRPVLIPAPFRRSHTPKANPLRGIASQSPSQRASRECHAAGQG